MDQDHIDGLLERYLHLLHGYMALREELTALQTGMYQNIARANFAAERGLRFGQDYYDDRMQASRRLVISYNSQDDARTQDPGESQDRATPVLLGGVVTNFTIVDPAAAYVPASTVEDPGVDVEVPTPDPRPEAGVDAGSVEQSATPSTKIEVSSAPTSYSQTDIDAQPTSNAGDTAGECTNASPPPIAEKERVTSQKSNDALRWFGLLTPMPLRQAQTQSIRAVEHVIPRLASLNAEMAAVEIEVRRARKRRAKAEAASRLSEHSG